MTGKVDQQAERRAGSFQIGSDLSVMCFTKAFDRFQLEHDLSFNEQVQAVASDISIAVMHWNTPFELHGHTRLSELQQQRAPINLLEKPWPKRLMHADDAGNDFGSKLVVQRRHPPIAFDIPLSPFLHKRELTDGPGHTHSGMER